MIGWLGLAAILNPNALNSQAARCKQGQIGFDGHPREKVFSIAAEKDSGLNAKFVQRCFRRAKNCVIRYSQGLLLRIAL